MKTHFGLCLLIFTLFINFACSQVNSTQKLIEGRWEGLIKKRVLDGDTLSEKPNNVILIFKGNKKVLFGLEGDEVEDLIELNYSINQNNLEINGAIYPLIKLNKNILIYSQRTDDIIEDYNILSFRKIEN